MTTPDEAARSRRGQVIAERYTLGGTIGYGGASVVYGAVDDVTGRRVAIKLLHPGGPQIGDRARREIAALRLLRLPGVVTLQDEGEHEGSPFLVMELVEGSSFPGCEIPAAWSDLAAPTLSMLETLARVHATGVVHRDLKPSNVLVRDDMNATILDFGVSWGPALGEALTAVGAIVGTPEYLAPEQLLGVRGDPRSDLYAAGVMLYEALVGRLPHVGANFLELMNLKRTTTPIPVRQLAPDTPRRVAQTVERLLALAPDDRPESVGEVIHQLYDREVTKRLTSVLPRLGREDLVATTCERLCAGHSVDVVGSLGSGRSRFLIDVAEAAASAGRSPRWTPPGTAPYASALAALEDAIDETDDLSQHELEDLVVRALRNAVAAGTVFLVDDPDQIDRWSAAMFEAARDTGGFVRVVAAPTRDCIALGRLSENDLRPMFAGPDRIFHLREDAAHELFRRTGGLPSRVAAEVGAWVRAGLARWQDGLVAVTRDALQRLAGGLPVITSTVRADEDEPDAPGLRELLAWITLAWPHTSEGVLAKATKRPAWRLQPELEALAQRHRITRLEDGRYQPVATSSALRTWPAERIRAAHRSLADTLPPGTPDRLRHLTIAGTAQEVIAEAERRGRELQDAGRFADAIVALEQGLIAARRSADAGSERDLLIALALVCLDDGTREAYQRGLYDLGRALDRSPDLERVAALLVAARDADVEPPESVRAQIETIGEFEDKTLETWRRAQEFRVAMRLGPAEEAQTIDAIEQWARGSGDPSCAHTVASWRALQVHHAGEPLAAARLHEAALADCSGATSRLAALSNASMAFLDGGDLDAAERTARTAKDEASRCRAAAFEAFAACTLRLIAYRRGGVPAPDTELLAAVVEVGDASLEGQLAITEAAIAWRAGDLDAALRLAEQTTAACRRYAEPGCDALPRALEIVCGAEADEGELRHLAEVARESPDAETAVETLGLLALVMPAQAGRLRAEARRRAGELTYDDPAQRRIVLSIDEATGKATV